MDFETYSKQALATAIYPNDPGLEVNAHKPLERIAIYPFMKLAGEAGEVIEKVAKCMRDDGSMMTQERRMDLIKELGDVLWYVNACADELGVDLRTVAVRNLDKLADRKSRNVIQGSGDNR